MALAHKILEGNRRRITATCGVQTDEAFDADAMFQAKDNGETLNFVKTDPDTVTFTRIRRGSTALESWASGDDPEVSHPSTGVFVLEVDFDEDGEYTVGCEGTGACQFYDELEITVVDARARA